MTAGPHETAPFNRQTLGDAYTAALEVYLACPGECPDAHAGLGRQALHDGLGPLDLVSFHESAIEGDTGLARKQPINADTRHGVYGPGRSPFEMTYRRFLASNVALRASTRRWRIGRGARHGRFTTQGRSNSVQPSARAR